VDTLAIDHFLHHKISYLQLIEALGYTYTHLHDLPVLREEHLPDIIKAAEDYAREVIALIEQ
jgi:hypothetical protein